MQKEIDAAVKAAQVYSPRNDGEAYHVDWIRLVLSDVATRAGFLDDYASEHDRAMAVHAANDARLTAELQLQAAQTGAPAVVASSAAPVDDSA